ncbi:MAG: hypothetical protein RL094_620 [Candidatus Parcubacteria bacterium]|jgi:hypothetical protein
MNNTLIVLSVMWIITVSIFVFLFGVLFSGSWLSMLLALVFSIPAITIIALCVLSKKGFGIGTAYSTLVFIASLIITAGIVYLLD